MKGWYLSFIARASPELRDFLVARVAKMEASPKHESSSLRERFSSLAEAAERHD